VYFFAVLFFRVVLDKHSWGELSDPPQENLSNEIVVVLTPLSLVE
jgi:hypothetical protein